MTQLVFLYSKVLLHWGFTVRQPGASAAQSAYIIPPPTTIIGAYANPLARILNLPDALDSRRKTPVSNKLMECALKSTISASASLHQSQGNTGIILFEEPSRIMGTPYKGGGSYEQAVKQPIYQSIQELLPVQAVGSASGPHVVMGLAWLLDKDRLGDCLGIEVTLEHFQRAAYNVYRVGSREGIANPVSDGEPRVYSGGDLEVRDLGQFSSLLYQDAECVKPVNATDVVEVVLLSQDYSERNYYVPALPGSGPSILLPPPPEPVQFKLRSGCSVAYPREDAGLALAFRRDRL
ncbi:MAG: hypothetical protein GSR73_06165 [Desulfurococcales archaeon]|nr:hypothetical protein [Desulfurococcales archaeon]